MKKTIKSYVKIYPILRLFKDDLEQIVTLFKENYKNYKIEADRYELDDISELSKIDKQEISDFSISNAYTDISLRISARTTTLYISDKDDVKLRGIFSKIDTILTKRKSFLGILTSVGMATPFIMIGLSPLFFLIVHKNHILLLEIPILILTFLWFSWSFYINTRRRSLIYLFNSHSKIGFFKRNKDKILLIIISTVIGSIATLFIEWLISKK